LLALLRSVASDSTVQPELDSSLIVALRPEGVTRLNQRQRRFRGQDVDALGHLKLIADRLVHRLAGRPGYNVADAAQLTRATRAIWTDGVCMDEWGTKGPIIFVVSPEGVGHLATESQWKRLVRSIRRAAIAINLTDLLAELRADAKARGIALPDRFTPKGGTESYFAWRAELEGFERAERMRAALKGGRSQP
jgi:hypothetical protein